MAKLSTIDVNIQSIAEKYLLEFNQAHKDEARDGEGSANSACIIMDPNTGEILAMASYPNFDLNNTRDLSAYYTDEEIAAIERTVPKIGPVHGDQPTAKIIPINKAMYHLLLSKFIFSFLSFNKYLDLKIPVI